MFCIAFALMAYSGATETHWIIGYVAPLMPIGLVAMLFPPLTKDARGRLCRLSWSRGDRGEAILIYVGWIPLKYSQKRLERNRRMREESRRNWPNGPWRYY